MVAYVINEIVITEPERFQTYADQVPAIIAQYGGAYVVRGGQPERVDGPEPPHRLVVLRFESREGRPRLARPRRSTRRSCRSARRPPPAASISWTATRAEPLAGPQALTAACGRALSGLRKGRSPDAGAAAS
jgi:uncharacterized protein (DUF1330 family)